MEAERKPGGFGGRLREARERKGLTLRQIANTTKISINALEALERNDFTRLPGGLFSRAFVRSYAVEVGLDPEVTIQDFIAQFPHDSVTAGHPPSEIEDNEALESDRRMASTVLRLLAVSAPLAVAVLYFISTGTPAPETPSQGATAATAGSSSPATDGSSVRADGTLLAVPPSAEAPQVIPPQAASTPAATNQLVVGLSMADRCWVSAIVDGQRVIGRELQPGERQVLEVKRNLVLSVGDAGAIAITLNGAPARPLGKPGQVVTIQMNVGNFKDYLAAR